MLGRVSTSAGTQGCRRIAARPCRAKGQVRARVAGGRFRQVPLPRHRVEHEVEQLLLLGHDGLGKAAAGLTLLLFLRFAMVWVGCFAGLLCGREEIAAQAGLLVFPIGMVSNVFVPIGGMPGWLRAIAEWNPVSTVAAACRSLFGDTTGPAPTSPWPLVHPVQATLGWCVLLLVVFAPLAVRRFSAHGR